MAIDPNSTIPVYQQIAGHIGSAVAAGVYRPGEAIPSLRTLALQLIVNPNTVQRAYEQLEREGLIEGRKGLGMFVTKNGAASARRRSEAAVYKAFHEGIRAGRAAAIPPTRIQGAFEKAWEEVNAETSDR